MEYLYVDLVKITGNPYLCDKIHSKSAWKSIDNPKGKRVHLLHSECQMALASYYETRSYCAQVKPICTPYLSGSQYNRSMCEREFESGESVDLNNSRLAQFLENIGYSKEEWIKDLEYQMAIRPSTQSDQNHRQKSTKKKLRLLYWRQHAQLKFILRREQRHYRLRRPAKAQSSTYKQMLDSNPEEFWELYKQYVVPSYEFAEMLYYNTKNIHDFNKEQRIGVAL